MISANDFKKGIIIIHNNEPWTIIDVQHTKVARGGGLYRTKIKNLKTGNVLEVTFKSGEKVEEANISYQPVQYLYSDETSAFFMDPNYEQQSLDLATIGDRQKYLKEGSSVDGLFLDDKFFDINLPKKMDFKVTQAPPGIKGDTATGGAKQVTLETGENISAPMFINEGDIVRVNTETGEYVERVTE
ncbi:MAG TPA: elongation factor P [Patescibacteria group bacterium]